MVVSAWGRGKKAWRAYEVPPGGVGCNFKWDIERVSYEWEGRTLVILTDPYRVSHLGRGLTSRILWTAVCQAVLDPASHGDV